LCGWLTHLRLRSSHKKLLDNQALALRFRIDAMHCVYTGHQVHVSGMMLATTLIMAVIYQCSNQLQSIYYLYLTQQMALN
jgi:hypothetical protein